VFSLEGPLDKFESELGKLGLAPELHAQIMALARNLVLDTYFVAMGEFEPEEFWDYPMDFPEAG